MIITADDTVATTTDIGRVNKTNESISEPIKYLASNGISVGNNAKLLQDKSIHLYEDGHLFDFGREGVYYSDVKEFIEARKDLCGAPVQANYSIKFVTPKWTPEYLKAEFDSFKKQWIQLNEKFKEEALTELLPMSYWNHIPTGIGYSYKHNSITYSIEGANVIRKVDDTKWLTHGTKKTSPSRLTKKDEVYIGSGMGEIILCELMGWDYVGLQSDSVVKYIPQHSGIKQLIILPDKGESFEKIVPKIIERLDPEEAYIVDFTDDDPRDLAKRIGNPIKLQEYINENKRLIHRSNKIVKKIVDIDYATDPINPIEFAQRLKTILIEYNNNFVVSEAMLEVFAEYASTYNMASKYNDKRDEQSKRLIVPLATGSAKTTGAKLYLAMCELSGILVVREAKTAIQAVKDINTFAGEDIARCTYSIDANNDRPDTPQRVERQDLKNYRVIVITHAMFQNLHKKINSSGDDWFYNAEQDIQNTFNMYNETNRAVIIIDERIDLKREESFDIDEVEDAINSLSGEKEIKEHLQVLRNLNEYIFTHHNKQSKEGKFTIYKDDMISYMTNARRLLSEVYSHISLETTILSSRPKIRGMKKSEYENLELKSAIKDLLLRINYVISGSMILSSEGKKTVVVRSEDYSMIFGSSVVLDATANVNKVYEVYQQNKPESIMMFEKTQIRDYGNVTFHIAKGFTQSKFGLYSAKSDIEKKNIIQGYLDMLYPITNEEDKVLVVVHKDVLQMFKEECRLNNITFINWGKHAGTNEWNQYNKAVVIGWFRLPQHYYASAINAGADGIINYLHNGNSLDAGVAELQDSLIADDMIQFFNRTRSRVSIDEDGNCESCHFYLFSDNTEKSKAIIKRMTQEFQNAKELEWSVTPATSLEKKKTKVEERADRIIELLKAYKTTHRDVRTETVRDKLGTTLDAFKKTVNSNYFISKLEELNIKYERAKSAKNRASFFDLSGV